MSKKEKGFMDLDNSMVILDGGGWREVGEGIRRMNSNGKNTKINLKIKEENPKPTANGYR